MLKSINSSLATMGENTLDGVVSVLTWKTLMLDDESTFQQECIGMDLV